MPVRLPMRLLIALALLAALLTVPVAPADAQSSGSLSIIKDDEAPSNAEIAVRLSEETVPEDGTSRVLISRDDEFADALASGLLQDRSPLLLVPSEGPVPDRVLQEIRRTGADSVVILGGTGAVMPQVEAQLSADGLQVVRRAGSTRIETAIDIARNEAPQATTAIMARAFATSADDPTQGFADALGAGGLAARNGWPILLSYTAALSAATLQYLADSDITDIKLVGGTAALSADVETALAELGIAVERIAGANRGATAFEIAKEQGAESAADVAHLILVDGTGPDAWAGGFAAAGRAAALDAPILLADGVRLTPEAQAFLTPGAQFAQAGELTITCVTHPLACTEGRRALGLVDYPVLTADPPRGVLVQPGQPITLTLSPSAEGAGVPVLASGNCLDGVRELTTDAAGQAVVSLSSALPPLVCLMEVAYESQDGQSLLRSTLAYSTEPPGARTADQAFIASQVIAFGSVVPETPVYISDRIACTAPDGTASEEVGSASQAQYQPPGEARFDTINQGSVPTVTSAAAVCTLSIQAPPEARRVFWGLYTATDSGLRFPLALGTGTEATVDLAALATQSGIDTRDVSVAWVVQIDDRRPRAPQPPPPGPSGVINNPDGLDIICGGQRVSPGAQPVGAGVACTVESPTPAFELILVQPDVTLQPAQRLQWTTTADSRFITVRALLSDAGGDAGSCATAAPVALGRITGGSVTAPGATAFHAFQGRAGDQLRIRLDAFGSEALDPVLTLRDPQGQVIASNDDAEGTLDSRLDVTLPVDGTYCVQAAGFDISTGAYLLAVDPFLSTSFRDASEIGPGTALAVPYTLTMSAGTLAVVEMRRDGQSSGTDPLLQVVGADGTLLAEDDDGGGFPNARLEFTAPADGVYDVIATVYEDSYGPYTIEGSFIAPDGTFSAHR
ncbi:hypothetical protein BH23ACT9_BH23ACT9_29130 [soil metagenome]